MKLLSCNEIWLVDLRFAAKTYSCLVFIVLA